MSSTYLYSDNDTTYDMSVSSTGTVLSYTDITTRIPLPSIQANANKYLKVRNDGKNLEWDDVVLSGGLDLILDERTTSNPPSILFEDAGGTQYNTGINMYRDTTNANSQTISLYANNVKKMDVAENRVVIGTVANNVPTTLNGSLTVDGTASANIFRAGDGTSTNPSYSFTSDPGTDTGMYMEVSGNRRVRFPVDGVDRLVLSNSGTASILGRLTLDAGTVSAPSLFFDTGTGLYRSTLNQLAITTNSVLNTNFTTTGVDIGTAGTNRNLTVNGNVSANIFRAGDGTSAIPSYSFANTLGTDTGMYYDGSSGDRINFSCNNFLTWSFRENFRTTSFRPLDFSHSSSAGAPLIMFGGDTTTGLYKPGTNQIAISTNSVLNTNFTATGVDIGTAGTNRNLTVNGVATVDKIQYSITTKTANFTIAATDNSIIEVNTNGGNIIMTLANIGVGRSYRIIKSNVNNSFSIDPPAGTTYNGSGSLATIFLATYYGVVEITQLSSTTWFGIEMPI